MSEMVHLHWGVSRVHAATLDLLEDEERRCLDLSILQCSILRQMVFPWVYRPDRLVEEHVGYEIPVEMPVAYVEALEELDQLLSGAYAGPKEGCPVGEVYVDRGDPSGWDFTIANLVADAAWHEMDLTNVIGEVSARLVLMRVRLTGPTVGGFIYFRESGNVATINYAGVPILTTTTPVDASIIIHLAATQKVDYILSVGVTVCFLFVRGYWAPAT